jgi:hypothetical protein
MARTSEEGGRQERKQGKEKSLCSQNHAVCAMRAVLFFDPAPGMAMAKARVTYQRGHDMGVSRQALF